MKQFALLPFGQKNYEIRVVPVQSHLSRKTKCLKSKFNPPNSEGAEIPHLCKAPKAGQPVFVEISDLIVERGTSLVHYQARVPDNGDGNILNWC